MEEHLARMERMEQMQKELQEGLIRSQEENQRQLSEMMSMMMDLVKSKGSAENSSPRMQNAQPSAKVPSPSVTGIPGLLNLPVNTSGQVGLAGGQMQLNKEEGHHVTNDVEVPDLDILVKEKQRQVEYQEIQKKMELMETKFKALDKGSTYGEMNVTDLSLVSDLVIPEQFKMPKFQKYDGTTCPKIHVTMYIRKMSMHLYNEKLLIHCFQDSLTGSAARWYTNLNRSTITTMVVTEK